MKQLLNIAFAALLLLCGQFVQAQSADESASLSYSIDELMQRYPANSIQSTDTAEEAVKAVEEARARIETRHAAEQQICYPKFFTTSCLNKAAERKRLDLLAIRNIEIEANAYIRHERVEKRDRKLEEKARERAAKNAADPILVEPKPDNTVPNENSGAVSDAQRKLRADAYAKKLEEHAQRQQQLQLKEKSEENERAANVEKYEAKQKESAERQRKVAERKAEKERARAKKEEARVPADVKENAVPGD